jgi:hypothetical protein
LGFGELGENLQRHLDVMTTLEGFEPVFGSAQLESSSSSSASSVAADPMFLFCLQPKGDDHLQVYVTDFHANTWYCDMSTEFLEDKVFDSEFHM